MPADLITPQDPRSQYPGALSSVEIQAAPATESTISQKPDCDENTNRESGRIAERQALLTGADSDIGRAAAIAFVREGRMSPYAICPGTGRCISYSADMARAEMILLEAASGETVKIEELAQPTLRILDEKYAIKSADIEPRVFVRLTDNWVELTVRFLCRDHDIRGLKDRMSRKIKGSLDAANSGIASSTYDIVGLPPIKVEMVPSKESKTGWCGVSKVACHCFRAEGPSHTSLGRRPG